MAAKDYKICTALFGCYIAQVSKKNPNLMLNDRRPVKEAEILELIDWYLDKELGDKHKSLVFNSLRREGKKVSLSFVGEMK